MENVVRVNFNLRKYSYKVGRPRTKTMFNPIENSKLKALVDTLRKRGY